MLQLVGEPLPFLHIQHIWIDISIGVVLLSLFGAWQVHVWSFFDENVHLLVEIRT